MGSDQGGNALPNFWRPKVHGPETELVRFKALCQEMAGPDLSLTLLLLIAVCCIVTWPVSEAWKLGRQLFLGPAIQMLSSE